MAARARRLGEWHRGEPRGRRLSFGDIGKALVLALLVVLALCRLATAASSDAQEQRETIVVASSEAPSGEDGSTRLVMPPTVKPVQSPIVYQPPRRGSPARGKVGGGVRGGSKALATPLALVPGHLAYTASASPSVFWHVDGPVEGARVFFSIMDEENLEGLDKEVEIEPPARSGINRVRLSDLGITLAEDTEYHWFISVVPNIESRDRDLISDGFVSRIADSSLDGHTRDASTFAELGLWYDALESLSDAIDTDPADPELRAQRNSLLMQAGLELAAR